MWETIFGCVLIVGSIAGLLYSTGGRGLGFHRPIRWRVGGYLTLVGEVSLWVFMFSAGALILQRNAVWFIPNLCSFIVLYISEIRASRRLKAQENELRATNALNYPSVFDGPPPTDFDAISGEYVDLYDAGACTFIGTVAKSDIRGLIDEHVEMTDEGPNDIYLLVESLEMFPDPQPSQEFISLLKSAFTNRDYLLLRWMPQGGKEPHIGWESDARWNDAEQRSSGDVSAA